uniref:CruI-1 n=1 Tax=Penaeus japonicus TaxID=27405 RepID=A0A125S9M0_PENJP|nr:CruI-1 [Penaeus japonicus]
MMIRLFVLLSVAAAVITALVPVDRGCRQYCKKWRPNDEERPAYCCDDGLIQPQPTETNNRGDCPDIRTHCLRFKGPPNVCAHDGFCPSHQKCCWDTCLDHHTCKPAQFPH